MNRRLINLVSVLLLLAFPLAAGAQTRSASNAEREAVMRELDYRLTRERGADIEIRIELAEAYPLGNNETGVRGRAMIRARNRDWESLWFDSALERRGGRVTRLDWGYGNRRGDARPGDPRTNDPRPDDRYQGSSSIGVLRNGRYEIQLVATNRLLDIGNGNQVVQREASRARSQQWDLEIAGGNYYSIRSAETGEVMTFEGRGESGDNVILTRERRNDEAQLWEIRPGPDNGYYFIARNGKSMDSPSSARNDGGRMQLYNRNGEANQRFRLRLVDDRTRLDDRNRGRDRYDDRGRENSGASSLRWSGRVDGEIEIEVRGNVVRERHISGQAPYDVRTSSGWSLPRRDVTVRVNRLRGRGRVEVVEQPTSRNGYVAVIRISDADRGADDYELEISWN
ncbi:MAG: RICIN domain-containing protein [Acidobacteria bacterium]|nr:RICIN domain-containing protein [Acidobacteriota bacterium]MBI3425953.1 RICIN domain-containing protein [Acidobacteriota bacterium]